MLPSDLVNEMKNAFRRSHEFLDLEMQTGKQLEMQSLEAQENGMAKNSTPQQQPVQIVAGIDQAEKMISQGWRFIATLPGEKAVFENFGTGKRDV